MLCKSAHHAAAVDLGAAVFVLVGAWCEAIVEDQEEGFYLLHYGHAERRWAGPGEIAWHDIAPMAYDVAVGKTLLAFSEARAAFDVAAVARANGHKGSEERRVGRGCRPRGRAGH